MQTSIRPTASPSPPPPPATLAANEKLASGPQSSLTELNVWQTQTFTPQMQWGNDYMHARYYSSGLGRFLSVDPVGGTIGSSQSWNRYSYVRNNPVLNTDPSGRATATSTVGFRFGVPFYAKNMARWLENKIDPPREVGGSVAYDDGWLGIDPDIVDLEIGLQIGVAIDDDGNDGLILQTSAGDGVIAGISPMEVNLRAGAGFADTIDDLRGESTTVEVDLPLVAVNVTVPDDNNAFAITADAQARAGASVGIQRNNTLVLNLSDVGEWVFDRVTDLFE